MENQFKVIGRRISEIRQVLEISVAEMAKVTGVTEEEYLKHENGVVESVRFESGCAGNTKGVAALVVGMKAEDAIARLSGIRCGFKNTSCPDQLAKALALCLKEEPITT